MATTRQFSSMEEMINGKLNDLEKSLASKKGLDELKSLILEQNEKIERQFQEIATLKTTVSTQAKEISNLNDKLAVLSSSISTLKKQSDHQEQYSRRYCLRIKGIEKEGNETPDICVDKVVKVCSDLNINVSPNDIDRAHRVGRDNKSIIVKFFSFKKRSNVYKKRKDAKNSIKIHLDLTKQRLDLLDEAKSLISESSNVDFVFADINCNTVAKLKDDKFIFFDSLEKFREILST